MEYVVMVLVTLVLLTFESGLTFRVVDLTHEHGPSTIFWPGAPDYNFTILVREQLQYYWYESNYFGTAEHGGTHMDSPAHFFKDKRRTAQIPMEQLVGPGVIIDIKDKAKKNPDYQVMEEDLQNWESQHGRIPKGAVVIMNSGWSNKYPNKTQVFSSATPNDPSTFHFPGWHENAIKWLVTNRKVHVVGVDTPSTDFGQSKSFPTHVTLGEKNVPGLENVANLDGIPAQGSLICAAVIKLQDGSGGPARVFAIVGDLPVSVSSHFQLSFASVILSLVIFFSV